MEDIILKNISILDHGIISNALNSYGALLKQNYQMSGNRDQLMHYSIAMELYHTVIKKLNSPMVWKKSPLENSKKNKKLGMRPHIALVLLDAVKRQIKITDNDYEEVRCWDIMEQLEKQLV